MKDKIVLITGASSGIGLATAEALAAKEAQLILVARSEDKLKQAIGQISAKTGNKNISYYLADFSSQKSIRALADAIKKNHQKIDVLINNAGGVFPSLNSTKTDLK
jgi:short-subunit dehydrogenase